MKMLGEFVRMFLYVILVIYIKYCGYLMIPMLQMIANGVKNELSLAIANTSALQRKDDEFMITDDEESLFKEYFEG